MESKELRDLAERCIALRDLKPRGWNVRRTQTGWYVQPPTPGLATTIPFRNHGSTLGNVTQKLIRFGLPEDEERMEAQRKGVTTNKPAPTTPKPSRPVPAATFTPAATPPVSNSSGRPDHADPQRSPVSTTAPASGQQGNRVDPEDLPANYEKPIPLEDIEHRVVEHFAVPMPMHDGKVFYKSIMGLKMDDGTERIACSVPADAPNAPCSATFSGTGSARKHVGRMHPSPKKQRADARKAERKAKELSAATPAHSAATAAGAASPTRVVAPARTATTSTPVVSPRAIPQQRRVELVHPEVPPERPARPVLPMLDEETPAASPAVIDVGEQAVDAFAAGLQALLDSRDRLRDQVRNGAGELRVKYAAMERRAVQAEKDKAELQRQLSQLREESTATAAQLEKLRQRVSSLVSGEL